MILTDGRQTASPTALLDFAELVRLNATRRLAPDARSTLGQFFTPVNVARILAASFRATGSSIRLLDPGAGVGSLTAAFVVELCSRGIPPKELVVEAYELDSTLIEDLQAVLDECGRVCEVFGIGFRAEVHPVDFISSTATRCRRGLFVGGTERFDCVVMNPPYRKISRDSPIHAALREIGVETTNLYTAFMMMASLLLKPEGELVAITPRSFCNGPYFKSFRREFLDVMRLERIHVFESRDAAFIEDEVLQENVVVRAVRSDRNPEHVLITSSAGPEDHGSTVREAPYHEVVRPSDPDRFIHVITDDLSDKIIRRMEWFKHSLSDLGIEVSTGRVVDFRAANCLRRSFEPGTAPLIYPAHFDAGFIRWPNQDTRKPNAIVENALTADLLIPRGFYVLVKRFSAKEERRRLVAAVYDPGRIPNDRVGFENHLNYYHAGGNGLTENLAKGLALFVNSTLVDEYFRLFSGHTQVNAADLRVLRYPSRIELERLGQLVEGVFPDQDQIDKSIERELLPMAESPDPIKAKNRIAEALEVLKALNLPREQQNDRSALALLALLNLKPDTPWRKADAVMLGITEMMSFFTSYYGKTYAPNTRETVRRFTVHQFLQAGLVLINPDDPRRPTNSPKCVYCVSPEALQLFKAFGGNRWTGELRSYLAKQTTLQVRYARERKMKRIPVVLPDGQRFTLSPGGQNILVKSILEEFCERFTPGAEVLYVGDTDHKFAVFAEARLVSLGVTLEQHGKMPDVVIYDSRRNWLVLIEAVTSHGPINPKRRDELSRLFQNSGAGLVYVTAFLDRKTMLKYLADISWETEVWIAESPSHMIHFNGERFLGPHES